MRQIGDYSDVFLDTSSSSLHKAGAFKRAYHYSAGDERPFSELPQAFRKQNNTEIEVPTQH
ncbi:hypothetical protein RB536_19090 [Escherichia coli]|nr:hypothetical protein RB536_19090 [Escherichia coli]